MSFETILNIVFTGLGVIYWGMVFVILYHLTRFGIGTEPKRLAAAFLFGAVILFCASLIGYHNLDLRSIISLI